MDDIERLNAATDYLHGLRLRGDQTPALSLDEYVALVSDVKFIVYPGLKIFRPQARPGAHFPGGRSA
jgi:hypothetical protein